MSIAITLHILATVIWIGGMFFAHMILRPSAAEKLEPPQRLPLWVAVFERFFFWVWIAVIILPITGYWMIHIFGGMGNSGNYVQIMHVIGWVMIFIFSYIYFQPYQALKVAVASENYPEGGKQINTIRLLVTTNLILGISTSIIASGGKYLGV